MELDDQLSPEDSRLAAQLAGLRRVPSPGARARIMATVRSAAAPTTVPNRRRRWRWRGAVIALAVTATLAVGSVAAFAATADALPDNPAYTARVAGEGLRLAMADPRSKEHLRGEFAKARLRQLGQVLPGGHDAALILLRDAKAYISQADQGINTLSGNERVQVEGEIHQLEGDVQREERQINQVDNRDSPAGGPLPATEAPSNGLNETNSSNGLAGQDSLTPGSSH